MQGTTTMWHWNSLWARGPGDPPPVDDPALYKSPWSLEQTVALQARSWDTLVTASHSWWSFWMAALPTPSWPQIGQVAPPLPKQAVFQWPLPVGEAANSAVAHKPAARGAAKRAGAPRKRAELVDGHPRAASARKR
ncbi:MAG: hypothetical protein RLZZ618_1078 [Pseudomonadota bacterium]